MKLAKLGDGPEIFHTLQGEGITAGCPAVFIRASRCNLHCVWCDTDHTWNFEGTPWAHEKDRNPAYRKFDKEAVTIELSPAEAARMILDFDCPRVVITGGEPLLQEAGFLEMIATIRQRMPECHFEMETNGTRVPSAAMAEAIDQFNVSPKLANSGMDETLRLPAASLGHWAKLPQAWFKFVVSHEADLGEILDLQMRFELPRSRILLMPEGRTSEALDAKAVWLAGRCRELGFRFSDRLHVRLWGDRRGV